MLAEVCLQNKGESKMGFLDKIVDVLGFVEREDVEEEEVVAERPVQLFLYFLK